MASEPLVFFGTGPIAVPVLQALIDHDYLVEAVITQPDRPSGRGRRQEIGEVAALAQSHQIPVLQPDSQEALPAAIVPLRSTAGVVASYGRILPRTILDHLPRGLINVHPSLLPKYRGPSPIEAAILNGDRQTGVTLMQVSDKMDGGPTYAQATLDLSGQETKSELYSTLSKLGAQILIEKLPKILAGELRPGPQNESEATYTKLIAKSDGQIDWSLPAQQIERQVRAYLGWPGSRTHLLGSDVTLTAVTVIPSPGSWPGVNSIEGSNLGTVFRHGKDLAVTTSRDALIIDRLIPAGKREMTGREFLAGHKL